MYVLVTENSPDKQNKLTTEASKWFTEILAWQVVENVVAVKQLPSFIYV